MRLLTPASSRCRHNRRPHSSPAGNTCRGHRPHRRTDTTPPGRRQHARNPAVLTHSYQKHAHRYRTGSSRPGPPHRPECQTQTYVKIGPTDTKNGSSAGARERTLAWVVARVWGGGGRGGVPGSAIASGVAGTGAAG